MANSARVIGHDVFLAIAILRGAPHLAVAEETIAGMFWLKAKLVVMVLAVGLAVGGAGWVGYKGTAQRGQPGLRRC